MITLKFISILLLVCKTYAFPDPSSHTAALRDEQKPSLAKTVLKTQVSEGYSSPLVGEVKLYSGDASTLPRSWMLCHGQALSRTEYQHLFSVIGELFGDGDGEKTFNIPDLRGRVAMGRDPSEFRINDAVQMGDTGGHATHNLTNEHLPAHSHGSGSLKVRKSGSHTHSIHDPGHAHSFNYGIWELKVGKTKVNVPIDHDTSWDPMNSAVRKSQTGISVAPVGNHLHELTGSTDTTGNTQSFSLLNPYQTLDYIIFTGNTGGHNMNNDVTNEQHFNINQTWKQYATTTAGCHGYGNQLNQLYHPYGAFIDDDQTIYVADWGNYRIVEWKKNAINGQIVAGGNGPGNQNDQLSGPTKVIIDQENDSLIICDYGNGRVVRWPRRIGQTGEILISNIRCVDLMMDNDGYLYVSDQYKHEVRRWKMGETNGTIVAGGNGQGNSLDQLNSPTNIFIDEDHSVYVSDRSNHRVMKWVKGAKEGIVVAGGQGEGNELRQLSSPCGIIVDQLGSVYVADSNNHRVMRWLKGAEEGTMVVGGNGEGEQPNQLNSPVDLSFDRENNLYVVDFGNNRVQRFDVNSNENV